MKAENKRCVNTLTAVFDSVSENEALARIIITGFITRYDVTAEILADVKTAVSEAVTNCIVHGYRERPGKIKMSAKLYSDGTLTVKISDRGAGIEDVKKAMEPFLTTDAQGERSGMGFAIMESFMDKIKVKSTPGKGTDVTMKRSIRSHN